MNTRHLKPNFKAYDEVRYPEPRRAPRVPWRTVRKISLPLGPIMLIWAVCVPSDSVATTTTQNRQVVCRQRGKVDGARSDLALYLAVLPLVRA